MISQANILLVDDDADFLSATKLVLQHGGYDVRTAMDEDQALAEIKKEEPDVLVLDVMMSERDSGFQFLWKLKRDQLYRHIPILMMTAVDSKMNIRFAQHAGGDQTPEEEDYLPIESYLVKPVDGSKLLEAVKTIMEKKNR